MRAAASLVVFTELEPPDSGWQRILKAFQSNWHTRLLSRVLGFASPAGNAAQECV